jgi:hypothetical protein
VEQSDVEASKLESNVIFFSESSKVNPDKLNGVVLDIGEELLEVSLLYHHYSHYLLY